MTKPRGIFGTSQFDGKPMINRLFTKSYPNLDWIQVEISSYCNANCIYCPHFAYRINWQNRHLPIDAFRNLILLFEKRNLSIHIAYMLLRSGLDELEKLPEFLSHTGVDQTVVSSLSFVASPAMESESILISFPAAKIYLVRLL
jgi:hypothetical protein